MKARVKATGEVFNILEINIPMGRVSVYLTEDTARDYRLEEVEVITNDVEGQNLTTYIDWGMRAHELQIALINNGTTDLHTINSMVESLIDYQCIKRGDDRFNQLKQNNYEQD